MTDPSPTSAVLLSSQLDRHAHRRAQMIPTVTVLRGPVGLGARAWRRWCQVPPVQLSDTDLETVVVTWTSAVARQRDLCDDALALLVSRSGQTVAQARAAWSVKTLHDLERAWEAQWFGPFRDGVTIACRWLIRGLVSGEGTAPEHLAGQLDQLLAEQSRDSPVPWLRVIVTLAELLPLTAQPSLLFVPSFPELGPVDWIDSVARLLDRILGAVPWLRAALAIPSPVLDAYLGSSLESRARALLREGVIDVVGLEEQALAERLHEHGVTQVPATSIGRLASDGATEELARALGEAARCLEDQATEEASERARSAAERFLFERLESLPQTAGLFALNAPLGFSFGGKPAEIDFLARDLGLALELDGYFHFLGPEAYRRDRRKDWELQRRGYVVLRFLAEDVVARMEEMLDTILAAVAHCRQRPERTRGAEQ
jgi:Protein of unknown function (DUF559)